MGDELKKSIVLDSGSADLKLGFAGETLPSLIMPNCEGKRIESKKSRFLKSRAIDEVDVPELSFGNDAVQYLRDSAGRVDLNWPVKHGVVNDWDAMERVLNHCWESMNVVDQLEESSLVVTQPPFNPHKCLERWCQTLFESFEFETMAMVPQGLCSLYASGRTTGVVLDSGDGVTTVTPVVHEYTTEAWVDRQNFGGNDVTNHLKSLLYEQGYNFSTNVDEINLRQCKEKMAYVAKDYQDELALQEDQDEEVHELPDGTKIKLGNQRFRCCELLFDPMVIQSEFKGVGQLVADAVKKTGIDNTKPLLGAVVLSGGNTLFDGFADRLRSDVGKFFPSLFAATTVIAAQSRQYSCWAGAGVLASLESFQNSNYIITKEDYDEYGPSVILGKSD